MNLPRQIFVIGGSALVLGAVMLGGLAFNPGRTDIKALAGGLYASPTFDPCQLSMNNGGGELGAAAQQAPCTPTEETLPKSHTPTPRPTDGPKTEAPNTVTPVPATNTPTGGAAGGGLRPPNTGTGSEGGNGSLQWLLVAGGMLAAVAGIGSLGYGVRRK